MILIALMCIRILTSPDNFKRVVRSQTFQTLFYCGFKSVTNLVFLFEPLLHEYVFIENNIVFNENALIVLHLHIILCHFHIVFSHLHENYESD